MYLVHATDLMENPLSIFVCRRTVLFVAVIFSIYTNQMSDVFKLLSILEFVLKLLKFNPYRYYSYHWY